MVVVQRLFMKKPPTTNNARWLQRQNAQLRWQFALLVLQAHRAISAYKLMATAKHHRVGYRLVNGAENKDELDAATDTSGVNTVGTNSTC